MTWQFRSRVAATVGVLALVGFGVAAAAVSAQGQRAQTSIASLRVSGSPAKPVFTMVGTGLSIPSPDPKVSPSGQSQCPLKIDGNAGLDYGNRFYVIGWDAQPGDSNTQLYSAGRYRPKLNELDCIGIVVLAHTPSKVSFTFGHAYEQYRSQYRTLRRGDVIEVGLNSAVFATVVHYGS